MVWGQGSAWIPEEEGSAQRKHPLLWLSTTRQIQAVSPSEKGSLQGWGGLGAGVVLLSSGLGRMGHSVSPRVAVPDAPSVPFLLHFRDSRRKWNSTVSLQSCSHSGQQRWFLSVGLFVGRVCCYSGSRSAAPSSSSCSWFPLRDCPSSNEMWIRLGFWLSHYLWEQEIGSMRFISLFWVKSPTVSWTCRLQSGPRSRFATGSRTKGLALTSIMAGTGYCLGKHFCRLLSRIWKRWGTLETLLSNKGTKNSLFLCM